MDDAVWGAKNREPILKPPILQQVCSHIISDATEKEFTLIR